MRERADIAVFIVAGLWVFMVAGLAAWRGATEETRRGRLWAGVVELTLEVEVFLVGLLAVSRAWWSRDHGFVLAGGLALLVLYLRVRWLLKTACGVRPEWLTLSAGWLLREVLLAAGVIGAAVLLRRWLPLVEASLH